MDFKKISMFMLVSIAMMPHVCLGLVGSRVNLTHVIAMGEILDESNNLVIQAAVGEIGSDPSTWTITVLSDGISTTNNFSPKLFTNTSGDVIVVWFYNDSNDVVQMAASILPGGTTTWYSANVSQSVGSAIYADAQVSLNESGKVLVVWTAQDLITGLSLVLGATADLGESTDWSSPFVILSA